MVDKVKLYLAHPFNSREYMRNWEQNTNFKNIKIINPFYHADSVEVFEDKDVSGNKYYKKLTNHAEIVERDVRLIKESDGIIAVVDGNLSYGTIQEIVYAYLYDKPVYALITNGHEEHPWLKYHAKKIFTDLNTLEKVVENDFRK